MKVFKLMWGVNETRRLLQYKLCECKCDLNESVCNSKQKWNYDEFQCECKELDNQSSCKTDYMWNPSTCDCERNKTCKIDEYLDIKNCSWEKHCKLVLACENEILKVVSATFLLVCF